MRTPTVAAQTRDPRSPHIDGGRLPRLRPASPHPARGGAASTGIKEERRAAGGFHLLGPAAARGVVRTHRAPPGAPELAASGGHRQLARLQRRPGPQPEQHRGRAAPRRARRAFTFRGASSPHCEHGPGAHEEPAPVCARTLCRIETGSRARMDATGVMCVVVEYTRFSFVCGSTWAVMDECEVRIADPFCAATA